ncbi:MAG: DUF2239 family protein [Gammaproteobacteria bacterium]|nr:DUF2239 family protein [Gammaproteobacteria bacterium]MBU1443613.1 DUF2239 family protein [Gammaproteobacteria bacterium]MBU2286734.1 DUF2239 family protein [Gammaproteobacteria bacterium]
MNLDNETTVTAFSGFERIASGTPDEVMALLRQRADAPATFIFSDQTGERLEIDMRDGSLSEGRALAPAVQGHKQVGRPKLGVVSREVTLLPRQWDWLSRQPGGASVALRRLVDDARRVNAGRDAQRAAREATYRFMTAIAGDLPGFEEATRALFAIDRPRFDSLVSEWPVDLREHLHRLAAASWETP